MEPLSSIGDRPNGVSPERLASVPGEYREAKSGQAYF